MTKGKPGFGQAVFVVGLQHGDEGKGKIVDLLAKPVSAVARGNGGSNAGHTLVLPNGKVMALHQLPSGIAYPDKLNVIGHGTLLNPVKLGEEMAEAKAKGIQITPDNLAISDMAHLVMPHHLALDAARESGQKAQGSTKSGIAFAASDKSLREGIRSETIRTHTKEQLRWLAYEAYLQSVPSPKRLSPLKIRDARTKASEFAEAAARLKPYLQDTPALLNNLLETGMDILVEGAQAFGLDIDHGKYPYTTSTGTTVPALVAGTGINPKRIGRVVGVAKATPSKVGGGSFVSRITDKAVADSTRGTKGQVDAEYGATSGREREVGYLDLVLLKRAIQINGVDELALTKFDCLKRHGKTTKIVIAYRQKSKKLLVPPNSDAELAKCKPVFKEFPTWQDDSSQKAERYLAFVEKFLGIPVSIVSNGPGREQVILRQ